MTIEKAIRILDPGTMIYELAEIEYYGGFKGDKAAEKALYDACVTACTVMRKALDKEKRRFDEAADETVRRMKQKEMKKIKPCPFCGKQVAEPSTAWDTESCANFEEEDCPECYGPCAEDCCIHMVVCSVNKGGCGSSTGWHLNADAAIEAWNNRTLIGENND